MKRAPLTATVGLILASAMWASAVAQGKPTGERVRIEQSASAGEVQITPSTKRAGSTSIEVGDDRWSARGYGLKALISEIYGIDARRIDIAGAGEADTLWDVTLQLADGVDEDAMQRMLKSALERKFGLKITQELRQMDVYVLTAPNGAGSALHVHGRRAGLTTLVASGSGESDEGGQITYAGRDCAGVVSSNGIEAIAGSIGELRRTLEPDLQRLLVDETHLTGRYDFKLGTYASEEELFQLMQRELGIVVTPGQRQVAMLMVRPAEMDREMRAGLE